MLGLKRGTVTLCPHEIEWERIAAETIGMLRPLFGDTVSAIEHVGSTSIRTICAKPILDIACAARDMEAVRARIPILEEAGVFFRALTGTGGGGELVQKLAPQDLLVLPDGGLAAAANGDQELAVLCDLHGKPPYEGKRKSMPRDMLLRIKPG